MYEKVAPFLPSRRENPPYPCDGLIYCSSLSSFLFFLSFYFLRSGAISLSLSLQVLSRCTFHPSFSVLYPAPLQQEYAKGLLKCSVILWLWRSLVVSFCPPSLCISLYLVPWGTLCYSTSCTRPLSLSLCGVGSTFLLPLPVFPR